MSDLTRSLTAVSAVGAGIAGGVFFAFSTFVMRALQRLPARQGLTAMQSINTAAPTPPFMLVLLGTGVTCGALVVDTLVRSDVPAAGWRLVGAGSYLATVALTIAYHVPRNDALGRLDPSAADAAAAWLRYADGWTAWNHVRTATSVVAAAALTRAALAA
jgi:uncharacterized membrane protein